MLTDQEQDERMERLKHAGTEIGKLIMARIGDEDRPDAAEVASSALQIALAYTCEEIRHTVGFDSPGYHAVRRVLLTADLGCPLYTLDEVQQLRMGIRSRRSTRSASDPGAG